MMSDSTKRELSVVVPVYNEIGCLDPLVDRVRGALDSAGIDWELVLVDDGSTDGSGEKMDELAAADDRIRVLHFEVNCGQTAGLDAGFRNARGALYRTARRRSPDLPRRPAAAAPHR